MSHQVRGMNRRPQITHIDQKHFVEFLQQLHPTRPRGQSFLQRLCNLISQLRLEGLHKHLGGVGKVEEHPNLIGPAGDLHRFLRSLTAKNAYLIARCERPLLAQFYSACTSFPTEVDRFTQKALLYLRSEEHTSELQSPCNLVCRLLLEKKNYHHPPVLCILTMRSLQLSCSHRITLQCVL